MAFTMIAVIAKFKVNSQALISTLLSLKKKIKKNQKNQKKIKKIQKEDK